MEFKRKSFLTGLTGLRGIFLATDETRMRKRDKSVRKGDEDLRKRVF